MPVRLLLSFLALLDHSHYVFARDPSRPRPTLMDRYRLPSTHGACLDTYLPRTTVSLHCLPLYGVSPWCPAHPPWPPPIHPDLPYLQYPVVGLPSVPYSHDSLLDPVRPRDRAESILLLLTEARRKQWGISEGREIQRWLRERRWRNRCSWRLQRLKW